MRFVAFLDILGFKDLVLNNEHKKLVELYDLIFNHSTSLALTQGNIIVTNKEEGKLIYQPNNNFIRINSIIVSDSIILWTDDCSCKSLLDLLVVVKTIFNHSFILGFPLRGAMSKGEFSTIIRNTGINYYNSINTYLGKALVDAYSLESLQNWSGFVIEKDNLFPEESLEFNIIETLIDSSLICRYSIPFKEDIKGEFFALNWVGTNILNKNRREVIKCFKDYNKKAESHKIKQIIENTIDFIESFR